MSSVVLKKGIEEPWASEREWQDSSTRWEYEEITLNSDTEPAIIAFRNRVAENCNAEVALEDAVKRRHAIKRIGRERSDVVARCHQNHQVPCGELRARRTPRRLPNLAVVGGTCGDLDKSILSRCQKGGDGGTPFERLHGKKPAQEFLPLGEQVLARPISSEPLNRMKSQIQVRSVAGSEKQQC